MIIARRLLVLCAYLLPIGLAGGQQVANWRLVEEWRVGGEPEGPHSFDFNVGVARLPNGGFVHFDRKSERLHFLDSLGKPVRSVGRKGGGPGESNNANGFAVAPDGRVVVNDRGNNRFTVFTPAGDLVETITLKGSRTSLGTQWTAIFLRDGRLLEVVTLIPTATRPDSMVRFLWSAGLTHLDTLGSCDRGAIPDPDPTLVALSGADGKLFTTAIMPIARSTTAFANDPAGFSWQARERASNEIVRRPISTCTIASTARLSGQRLPFSSQDKDSVSRFFANTSRQMRLPPPTITNWPAEHPWFRTLQVDERGNLWVERDRPGFLRSAEVFSSSGQLIARIADGIPLSPRSRIITDSHVYGLVVDDSGVQYFAAFRIVR